MISSITVTYNPEVDILVNQLTSLINQVDQIFVVDNFSRNIKEIKEKISSLTVENLCNIKLIPLEENVGLAKAQNIAIRQAKEEAFEYVILFDQDSVPTNNFVKNLYKGFTDLEKQGEKVAAVGPFYIDPKANEFYPATVYVGPFIKRLMPENSPLDVTFIIASGSLISLKNINEIGLMKEDFFIDYIDVEWCLRAKQIGYKLYMLPNVTMIHSIGDKRINFFGRSISVHTPLRRYYLIRNSFIISRLGYIPFGYKVRELCFNFFRFFIFIIVSEDKRKVWSFSLKGLVDGILGKTGKKEF